MKNIKKPIIISGIPRSGTTPLCNVLSSIKGFSMIYEPFNANQGIIDVQFNYPYPGKNISVDEFQSIFKDLVQFKSSFKKKSQSQINGDLYIVSNPPTII